MTFGKGLPHGTKEEMELERLRKHIISYARTIKHFEDGDNASEPAIQKVINESTIKLDLTKKYVAFLDGIITQDELPHTIPEIRKILDFKD